MLRPTPPTRFALAAVLAAQCMLPGCAMNGLPRIDPSGNSFLIFPDRQATAPPPGTFATPGTAPGGSPNLVAPPVYSDGTSTASAQDDFLGTGALYDNTVRGCLEEDPPATAMVDPTTGQAVDVPEERLTLTPSKILAPVGSEVVLRAGVCNQDGYTRTNRRVEWMLGQQGSGQFVEIGELGEHDLFRFPWEKSKKIDNTYAVSYSTPVHKCLDRGTTDVSDDLQIQPGDAWVTVTSAAEGTSYVTAYAPSVGNWPARRANATIYWVDAQWQFPPSVTVPAGQKHILTTTVTRKTDGAPIAGWIVRYNVQGGSGARLGYEAGQTTEATTDNRGRASVELTPTDNGPGTTNVGITVIRPEQAGVASSPRVEVGTGAAAITWSPTALPVAPEPGAGVVDPPQYLPPGTPPSTPQPPPIAAPELEVRITSASTTPVRQGEVAQMLITVRNTSAVPARGIKINADYDQGLSNQYAKPGEYSVEYNDLTDLGPGESDSVRLDFNTLAQGNQCVNVEVTATGSAPSVDRHCVNVQPPAAAAAPSLEIIIQPERQRSVGEVTTFPFVIRNTGATAAVNMVVTMEYEQSLDPVDKESMQRPGVLQFTAGRLEPGAETSLRLGFKCLQPDPSATVTVSAIADNMPREARKTAEVEILPAPNSPNDGGVAPAAGNLRATITTQAAQVGRSTTFYVTLTNTGATPEQEVDFRVKIPPQFRPNLTGIENAISARNLKVVAKEPYLEFSRITELRPNEPVSVPIVVDVNQPGDATVRVEYRSQTSPTEQFREEVITVAPR